MTEAQKSKVKSKTEEKSIDPSQLTTFKIGNFSKSELEAKTELQMPYEKYDFIFLFHPNFNIVHTKICFLE